MYIPKWLAVILVAILALSLMGSVAPVKVKNTPLVAYYISGWTDYSFHYGDRLTCVVFGEFNDIGLPGEPGRHGVELDCKPKMKEPRSGWGRGE